MKFKLIFIRNLIVIILVQCIEMSRNFNYLLINNFLKNNERKISWALLKKMSLTIYVCENHRTTDRLNVRLHLLYVELRLYLMFTYIYVIFNI